MCKYFFFIVYVFVSIKAYSQYNENNNYRPKALNEAIAIDSRLNDYDVKFYKLDLNMTPDNVYIEGSVKAIVQTTVDDFEEFVAQLDNAYTVDSVKVNEDIVLHTHLNNLIEVFLEAPLNQEEILEVVIWYHGSFIYSGEGLCGIRHYSTNGGIISTCSESFHAKEWWPCKEVVSDKADSVWVFITVPDGNKVGSNGLLSNIEDLDDFKRYEWKHKYPIAYYLIAVAVSDFIEYNIYAHPEGISDSILIQNYLINDEEEFQDNKLAIDETAGFLEFFSDVFGMYPFVDEKYGHCQTPGGIEHQTMAFVSGFAYNNLVLTHELAHQWFGNNVTCATWQDIWINEGFATYAQDLALMNLFGISYDESNMEYYYSYIFENEESVYVSFEESSDETRIFGGTSYFKGALIIDQIRFIINNDELFFQTLKDFQLNYGGGVATGEDFKNQLLTTTGIDFANYFDQWYYGVVYPIYFINWWNEDGVFNVNVEQSSSNPDTFPFIDLPFELKLFYSGNDTLIRFDQATNTQLYSLSLGVNVDSVHFDPRKKIADQHEVINSPVNVKELDARKFDIFPNPASSTLKVLKINSKQELCTIYNEEGKLVKAIKIEKTEHVFEVDNWKKGLYLVKLGDFVKKVIIE